MSNFTGLSVGRIVHFFTTDKTKHSNGQGEGPYPAMVLQTFDEGRMGNLKVWTYDGGFVASSVSEKEAAEKAGHTQWYVWPPRT
jgi:hypothetical protein